MNTFFRICTVLALAGTTSLLAADGDNDTLGGKGDPGPRGGRGHGPGGHRNVTFMVCPNCHHRLVVIAGRGHGPGGKEGREGREGHDGERRGPRGPRRGKGQKRTEPPQKQTTEQQNQAEKTN